MDVFKQIGFIALGIAAYMVLVVWILPRLGVHT